MSINIQGNDYNVLGVYDSSITLPDSFASQNNKYGTGHGEAKLYVGTKTQMNSFFGAHTDCFVLKKDFESYTQSLQSASSVLAAIYKQALSRNKRFDIILNSIAGLINRMNSIETFSIKLMNHLSGQRGYINSQSKSFNGYSLLRACCIPFVSFIRILKLEDVVSGRVCFYIKLFPNFDEMYQQVQYIKNYGKRNLLSQTKSRPGQNKYKKGLVQEFGECPFSHIKDDRLLIASHIMPFASCNKAQQYDVDNGLLLSPLYDKLFDKGFITFDQQGNLKKTIWISPSEWVKIPLTYAINDLHLTANRKNYLKFHETHVFLGD